MLRLTYLTLGAAMSLVESIRGWFKRRGIAGERSVRDKLYISENDLTIQRGLDEPVSIRAGAVVAIWYDYNPFGWQHANSLRLVYAVGNQSASIDIYDEEQTFKLLLSWLHHHFPASVSSQYRELWGSPGGDDPSIELWASSGNRA